MARLVRLYIPKPRRIGRKDLVDEHDVAAVVLAEFELGIGDDQPALECKFICLCKKFLRGRLEESGGVVTDDLHKLDLRDVVIVADVGLSRRCKYRHQEFVAMEKSFRQLVCADLA